MKKIGLSLLLVFALTSVANAQNLAVIHQELADMREDIQILQRRMYTEREDGDMIVKVGRLDETVRTTTGRLDEMEYKIRQLEEKIDMINKDIDVRMKLLEGKKIDVSNTPAVTDNTPKFSAPVAVDAPTAIVGGSISKSEDLTPVKGSTVPEIYQAGLEAWKDKRYDEAEKAFNKILIKFPNDKLAGNAQYWLGETYYGRKQYDMAAVAFATVYQQYHGSPKAPDSLFKLGMSMKEMKKNKEACTAFLSLNKEFPKAFRDRVAAEKKKLGCK